MSGELCAVPGCSQSAAAKHYCPRHYQQWRRTGAPVSNRGVVRRERVYLNLPVSLMDLCRTEAAIAGVPLRDWVEQALSLRATRP